MNFIISPQIAKPDTRILLSRFQSGRIRTARKRDRSRLGKRLMPVPGKQINEKNGSVETLSEN